MSNKKSLIYFGGTFTFDVLKFRFHIDEQKSNYAEPSHLMY